MNFQSGATLLTSFSIDNILTQNKFGTRDNYLGYNRNEIQENTDRDSDKDSDSEDELYSGRELHSEDSRDNSEDITVDIDSDNESESSMCRSTIEEDVNHIDKENLDEDCTEHELHGTRSTEDGRARDGECRRMHVKVA